MLSKRAHQLHKIMTGEDHPDAPKPRLRSTPTSQDNSVSKEYVDGQISDVRVHPRALSPEDIRNMVENSTPEEQEVARIHAQQLVDARERQAIEQLRSERLNAGQQISAITGSDVSIFRLNRDVDWRSGGIQDGGDIDMEWFRRNGIQLTEVISVSINQTFQQPSSASVTMTFTMFDRTTITRILNEHDIPRTYMVFMTNGLGIVGLHVIEDATINNWSQQMDVDQISAVVMEMSAANIHTPPVPAGSRFVGISGEPPQPPQARIIRE